MPRKQMNIRIDELTRQTIKQIAKKYNMSESQVVTRGVLLLEQSLRIEPNVASSVASKSEKADIEPPDAQS